MKLKHSDLDEGVYSVKQAIKYVFSRDHLVISRNSEGNDLFLEVMSPMR